jgi:peptide/nickel transport system permease protein
MAGPAHDIDLECISMQRYIALRLLQAIPTILLITVISFAIMHVGPQGVAVFYSADLQLAMTAEEQARFMHIHGLDRPLPVQYLDWLGNLLRGDLGRAFKWGEPVSDIFRRTVPHTVLLMASAVLLALAVAVPVGVVAAFRRGSFFDYLVTVLAMLGVSVPTFWFALMSILVFGLWLHWFPTGGISSPTATSPILDRIHHLILPAFVQSLPLIGAWSRFVRSSMLEVLGEDYVRTARAKGLAERAVLFRHALRNALLPLVTLLGVTLAHIISNSAVVEFIFAWPGLGQTYVLSAARNRDYPVLMPVLVLVSVLTVAGSLLADIAYAVVDPRIRYGD